eukprot:1161818-Pelagomonas_calceolata.AAC.3
MAPPSEQPVHLRREQGEESSGLTKPRQVNNDIFVFAYSKLLVQRTKAKACSKGKCLYLHVGRTQAELGFVEPAALGNPVHQCILVGHHSIL